MTRFKAAGMAETQQDWSQVLRITEVSAGLPPSQPTHLAALNKLQEVFNGVQAAWRWVERKRSQQLSAKRLRVAETVSLGEKRTVSIIMVDGQQFLIGSSTSGVQLLTRLDELSQNERTS